MSCRKNQRNLTSAERQAFVNAMVALKTTVPSQLGLGNRYDDYVHWHMLAMDDGSAHRGPAFLPWHREYLRRLELDLRAVDPTVSIPYWDWTVDNSPNPATAGSPWTADFMGGNGDPADNDKVTTGAFAQATGNWPLNMDEDGFGFLRRSFGTFPGAGTLPTANNVTDCLTELPYDEAPWDDDGTLQSFRNRLEGWFGPGSIHNRVHLWVGGSMLPGTSPNDPVFFLHHCNIDRLWTVWERQHPGELYHPQGVGPDTGPAGHNVTNSMSPWGGATTIASVLDSHAIGVWYDTDPPEIVDQTTSLSFVDIQQGVGGTGVTTYRAVLLEVVGCSPVEFEFVGPPTGGFTTAGDEAIEIDVHDAPAATTGRLWIAYNTNLGTIAGQVTVRARARDSAGTVIWEDTWDVSLAGNSVPRQRSAITVVLDRSGSMAGDAGDGLPRIDKLRSAMHTFIDLMQPGDGMGIVRFDHEVNRLTDVADVGTPGPDRDAAIDIIDTHDPAQTLDPRGATAIGAGLIEGQAALNDAAGAVPPYDTRAILVMTDGNENVAPMIASVAASAFDAQTFAIGFGPAHDVSAPALMELTDNHEGYMVVTGAITESDQFRLTKYFLQIQASITNQQIVVDPAGNLVLGAVHRIPFVLSEAEMGIDVIVLSPAPYYIDFALETPSGELIDPARAAVEPAIEFALGRASSFYRLTLPALPSVNSHSGQWHALLRLGQRASTAHREMVGRFKGRVLPYSLLVHAHSNLRFSASLSQASHEPGASATIFASLREYDVPVERRARVWAEITGPTGTRQRVTLDETAPGDFTAACQTGRAGVYTVRLYARGNTFRGTRFTREQTLSIATFKGGDKPRPSEPVPDVYTRPTHRQPTTTRPAAPPASVARADIASLVGSPELREAFEVMRMEALASQESGGFAALGKRPTPPRAPVAPHGGHHARGAAAAHDHPRHTGPMFDLSPQDKDAPGGHDQQEDYVPPDKGARHTPGDKHTDHDHAEHDHGTHAHGARDHGAHKTGLMFGLSPQDTAAPGGHDTQDEPPSKERATKARQKKSRR